MLVRRHSLVERERGTAVSDKSHSGGRDRFGGTTRVRSEATGFFRVEEIGGRWWFITPDGHGFLSVGVNHIDSACLKYPDNVHIWNGRYGDERSFCESGVRNDLQDWGFNTVGWSQEVHVRQRTHTPPWRHEQYRWVGMPYCHAIPFTEIEMWNRYPRFPDVFTDDFEQWCDLQARYCCVDMAADPWLIGYFYADIPSWGRNSNSGVKGWAEMFDMNSASGRAELGTIAARYYQVTHDAIRRYDPNHLILGDRYNGQGPLPEAVLEAMVPTVDVLSIQHFPPIERFVALSSEWHRRTGKPVVNADVAFHVRALGRDHPHGITTQRERGQRYAQWAGKCFAEPHMIGWHWCGYIENECRQAGLKDRYDEPQTEALDLITEFNHQLYDRVAGSA